MCRKDAALKMAPINLEKQVPLKRFQKDRLVHKTKYFGNLKMMQWDIYLIFHMRANPG